jgi:hypothetical protein
VLLLVFLCYATKIPQTHTMLQLHLSEASFVPGGAGDRGCCSWLPCCRKHDISRRRAPLATRRCIAVASSSRLSSIAASQEFIELAEISGTGIGDIEARPTATERGLVTTAPVEKGDILLQVPLSVR